MSRGGQPHYVAVRFLRGGVGRGHARRRNSWPRVCARALCGPTRKARVSTILQGETGLPGSLGGIDRRSGERFGFQRWVLGRTNGAWLGASDSVEVPLMVGGKHEILLRPHATERSPQGQVSLGVHELRIASGSWLPVRVVVDPLQLGQALQQLDQ